MNDHLTLLWKEFRSNVHLIIVGISVLLLPVLIVISMTYGNDPGAPISEFLAAGLLFGTVAGLILSQVMMLCLGGQLIGGERSARTFEFLFSQPVSKSKIVTSKLVFAFVWMVITWSVGGLLLFVGSQLAHPETGVSLNGVELEFFAEIAATGGMLFAASWLASTKVESPVLAIALGALATTAAFLLLQFLETRFESVFKIGGDRWARIIALSLLSITATVAGARIFVNRKAP